MYNNGKPPAHKKGAVGILDVRTRQPPEDDVFAAFTICHLLRGNDHGLGPLELGQATLSSRCFVALSTVFFGLEHRHGSITQRGVRRYTHALAELNQALSDPQACRTFGLLEAVVVMTLFEFLFSDGGNGWVSHSRGLEHILAMMGPEAMTSLSYLDLLERSRPGMIFSAIVLHQRTIFSQPSWKNVPWKVHPGRKEAMQVLFDIIADCADVFWLRDQSDTEMVESAQLLAQQAILEKARTILCDLYCWKESYASSPEFQPTEAPASCASSSPLGNNEGLQDQASYPWTTVMSYESLYHANAMTLYHGAIILIGRPIRDLHLAICGAGEPDTQRAIYEAGIAICRSVEYLLDPVRNGAGSFYLLFPIRMAFDAVGKAEPAIGAWLKATLQLISSGSAGRWTSAKHLLRM
ncbi:hypothetical protein PG995_004559 [Apiospora arundinis]